MTQSSNENSSGRPTWGQVIGGGAVAGTAAGATYYGLGNAFPAAPSAAPTLPTNPIGDPISNPGLGDSVDMSPVKDFFGNLGDGVKNMFDGMQNFLSNPTSVPTGVLLLAAVLVVCLIAYAYSKKKGNEVKEDEENDTTYAMQQPTN